MLTLAYAANANAEPVGARIYALADAELVESVEDNVGIGHDEASWQVNDEAAADECASRRTRRECARSARSAGRTRQVAIGLSQANSDYGAIPRVDQTSCCRIINDDS